MVQPIRIVNAFFAALFLVAAAAGLAFVATAMDGLGSGPGAVGQALARTAAAALFAALCFVNMRRAARRPGPWLAGATLAALALACAGLVFGAGAMRWIAGISAIPFAVTLAGHRGKSA